MKAKTQMETISQNVREKKMMLHL